MPGLSDARRHGLGHVFTLPALPLLLLTLPVVIPVFLLLQADGDLPGTSRRPVFAVEKYCLHCRSYVTPVAAEDNNGWRCPKDATHTLSDT